MPDETEKTGDNSTILHAGCISLNGRGCLITGGSGSGKSSLALALMAYGGGLVSDDRVVLRRVDHQIMASGPTSLRGMIEARGVGILTSEYVETAAVSLIVDLDRQETERLPEKRMIELLGLPVPVLYRVEGVHFAPALIQFLKSGRRHP